MKRLSEIMALIIESLKPEQKKQIDANQYASSSKENSSYVVGPSGRLWHHALTGLDLNALYQDHITEEINFGHVDYK